VDGPALATNEDNVPGTPRDIATRLVAEINGRSARNRHAFQFAVCEKRQVLTVG
jgi:hypothetical protein